MPTIASIENSIREAAPDAKRSDIKRAAKLHLRRFAEHIWVPSHEEALLLVKAITYADITGDTATGIRRAS